MSSLNDRLARIKAGFLEQVPPEVGVTINEAVQGLRDSGIMNGVPTAGTVLPAFNLPDTEGQLVSSAGILAQGPMVLTVYRGVW